MSQAVTTGKVRLSYTHLLKPYAYSQGQEPRYSTTILIPKDDLETYQAILDAIDEATEWGIPNRWNGQKPAKVANPLYDGDGVRPVSGEPFGDECKGHWVITASSSKERPPEVVDENMNRIISPGDIYAGCYANVYLTFFPYNSNGRKGIGCGLGPVQKVADGEPLGGGGMPKASNIFKTIKREKRQINPITGEEM